MAPSWITLGVTLGSSWGSPWGSSWGHPGGHPGPPSENQCFLWVLGQDAPIPINQPSWAKALIYLATSPLRFEYEKPNICVRFASSIETLNPHYNLALAVLTMKNRAKIQNRLARRSTLRLWFCVLNMKNQAFVQVSLFRSKRRLHITILLWPF